LVCHIKSVYGGFIFEPSISSIHLMHKDIDIVSNAQSIKPQITPLRTHSNEFLGRFSDTLGRLN